MTVPAHQTNPVTFVLIFRIPTEGVEDFRAYEEAVLPLLPEFNGRLERRLRNPDGTVASILACSFELGSRSTQALQGSDFEMDMP